MLQRLVIHFSLILLFAFTQMGVATHAVSHLADGHEQHQQDQNNQDKNNHENQCGQCLSLSHIADAGTTATFDFQLTANEQIFAGSALSSFTSLAIPSYSARAPPYPSQALTI